MKAREIYCVSVEDLTPELDALVKQGDIQGFVDKVRDKLDFTEDYDESWQTDSVIGCDGDYILTYLDTFDTIKLYEREKA